MKKILFMVPYPKGEVPSQRFRLEHYLKFMEQSDLGWNFQSFVLIKTWKILYERQQSWTKLTTVLDGFFRRFFILFKLKKYDFIFIHRELTPMGPPIFEWIIAKILRKKIIYDFDDAIWLPDQTPESLIWKWLKWRSKVGLICKWSWKVSAGNEYLAEFTRQYNKNVTIMPTVVDTNEHKAKSQKLVTKSQRPVIGWTGSHSTIFYLNMLIPALKDLEKVTDFEFFVIADQNPNLPLKNYRFIKWNKDTEIEDLSKFDIGVMPLEDNDWTQGKCGFKLIQYLSIGIPAVASPVGVNKKIIQSGVTGLFAKSKEEWVEQLKKLLMDDSLRADMGSEGRKLILEKYSVASQKQVFLSLFES